MKLALYQGTPTNGNEAGAFDAIERVLGAAAAAGAEMAVFPELYLPGYNRPDLHAQLSQTQGGAWEEQMSGLCRRTGCGLTIGWAERSGSAVFNAASTFDKSGHKLAHYRKIQLFGPMERASFVPGDTLTVFDFGEFRAALLICYDVEFAHHVQALSEQKVDLLLVPTANPEGFENVSEILVPARAYETAMTIAYANFCGSEAGLRFGGGSVIVGPDGNVLATAGRGEALLVVDLSVVSELDPAGLSNQRSDRRTLE